MKEEIKNYSNEDIDKEKSYLNYSIKSQDIVMKKNLRE